MSLNISDAANATTPLSLARSSASAVQSPKRASAQTPDGIDAAPKPRSSVNEPDDLLMRPHPAASADDPLQRLREAPESGSPKGRARKTTSRSDGAADANPAGRQQKARTPYDPPPTRQHDLDLLA